MNALRMSKEPVITMRDFYFIVSTRTLYKKLYKPLLYVMDVLKSSKEHKNVYLFSERFQDF